MPAGFSGETAYRRHLVAEGAADRYGPRDTNERAYAQLEVIGRLGFAGYFLVVWDIVRFCREHNLLAQGRGSAANSAIC